MTHRCKGPGFADCHHYTSNFWIKHAGRDGRWTVRLSAGDEDDGGPEAERFVPLPPRLPVLTEMAARRLPRPALREEARLLAVT